MRGRKYHFSNRGVCISSSCDVGIWFILCTSRFRDLNFLFMLRYLKRLADQSDAFNCRLDTFSANQCCSLPKYVALCERKYENTLNTTERNTHKLRRLKGTYTKGGYIRHVNVSILFGPRSGPLSLASNGPSFLSFPQG